MYIDDDSVAIFARMHARDVLIEQARHVGDPVEDTSLFASHARAERSAGHMIAAVGLCVMALFAGMLLKLF